MYEMRGRTQWKCANGASCKISAGCVTVWPITGGKQVVRRKTGLDRLFHGLRLLEGPTRGSGASRDGGPSVVLRPACQRLGMHRVLDPERLPVS
jgi:hypothetical protein